jgi:chemotaxis protein MotB
MSTLDAEKFEKVAQSLSSAFSANTGGDGILEGVHIMQPLVTPIPHVSYSEGNVTEAQKRYELENAQLANVQNEIERYIAANNLSGELNTRLTEEGLVLTMREAAFFDSGSATIFPDSQSVIREIATILTTINQRVVVAGYTDNMPIHSQEFPSNWDLSTKRAVNFMRSMFALEPFLRPKRFSVAGYGEFHPVADNSTESGRKQNRRVEIIILRNYPNMVQSSPL